eukprot:826410-Rhodomonas_salina.1
MRSCMQSRESTECGGDRAPHQRSPRPGTFTRKVSTARRVARVEAARTARYVGTGHGVGRA